MSASQPGVAGPRRFRLLPLVLFAGLVVSALGPAAHAADPNAAKDFEFELSGRLMIDWFWGSADEQIGPVGDGVEFRRARVEWSGTFWSRVSFKAQFDMAQGNPEFKDVTISLDDLPGVGSITVGHFIEPFSLDNMTSSRYITFAERSVLSSFGDIRGTGVGIGTDVLDGRFQWGVGVFRDVNDFGDNQDAEGNVTGDDFDVAARISGLPVWLDRGKKMVHLGLSYQHQDRDTLAPRFRMRPDVHFAPRLVDTGRLNADAVERVNLEAAFVRDSVSVQAQFESVTPNMRTGDDPTFSGWYALVSWFPTGEFRRYSMGKGVFSRVRPNRNFMDGTGEGWGAWELKARLSSVDLNDGPIRGGEMDVLTAGANWYLNPRTRVMLELSDADVDGKGSGQWALVRFQVDF